MTRRLAFVLLAVAAAQAAQYVVRPLTSYRLLALRAGAREVGLVTGAFALAPLGTARRRRRRDPRARVGAARRASSGAAIATATALFGLGHLGLMLGVQNVIARESADELHDRRFGLFTATVSRGQMVGPLLGGWVLSSRGQLGLIAATGRGMEIAAGLALLATVAAALASARRSEATEPSFGGDRGRVHEIAVIRGVPAGIFASVALLSCTDVLTAYLPVLGQQRGINPGVIGALLALRAGASMAARVGIVPLVKRVGRLRLIAASTFLAGAAVVMLTATNSPVVLAILMTAAGYGLGFSQPLT